ncbi:MAG: TRAP transporter substrate-binding protein DctP [Magnetococcales bacterium]|nr:TRAP transporter substrate-binding protein DctP [Magnetococcales bacterium]MBF0150620.1 TRAP transporter substrate-binding protein DctP [Magnetococcales bacterium]MBF0174546.1 TRAP transporter substrate-binding protein DctP [Magnetococcales bacterium]MBF0348549.1 TRAP transporter substrate-binding protein DctP [Magnetococcales bacterium]MBF0629364.1 TRAP transporter substrate-binding protein DctP [Magnetococcales bacterium]
MHRLILLALMYLLAPWTMALANDEVIPMRITAVQGEGMVYVRLLHQLKQNIENGTQGRIRVELLTNGAGGSEIDALKNQIRGNVEGGWISVLTLAQAFKAFRVMTLPMVFNDAEQLNHFVGSKLDTAIRATTKTKNIKVLGYGSYGFYGILLFENMKKQKTRPGNDALDWMNHQTIRVPEDDWIGTVQATLPGKKVQVPSVDLMKAMDSGWITGLLITPELVANKELMQKAAYFLNLRHLHAWSAFSVNQTWLESLPREYQKVVQHEVRAMCQQALDGGLAHHDALVAHWYETRHPRVVQTSWDRMAILVQPLVEKTIQQMERLLGPSSRVSILWENNYKFSNTSTANVVSMNHVNQSGLP